MTRLFLDVETYSPGPHPTHDDKIIAIAYKQEYCSVTYSVAWTTFSGGLASQEYYARST